MNWEEFADALEGPLDLIEELLGDVVVSDESTDGDCNRRNLVRSAFAALEGIASATKQLCVLVDTINSQHPTFGVSFTAEERMVLRESEAFLDEKGDIGTRPMRLSTSANMLFAFKTFLRLAGASQEIDRDGAEWSRYKAAIRVRDRLTHPKKLADLKISDVEMEGVKESLLWWATILEKGTDAFGARSHAWRDALHAYLGPLPPLP